MPFKSLLMMASSDDATMARKRCRSKSAALRAVISRITPSRRRAAVGDSSTTAKAGEAHQLMQELEAEIPKARSKRPDLSNAKEKLTKVSAHLAAAKKEIDAAATKMDHITSLSQLQPAADHVKKIREDLR